MTFQELQTLVAQAVAARGYREGWADEQYAARQVCKAVEELGEVQTAIEWRSWAPNWAGGLQFTSLYARRSFDSIDDWGQVVDVDCKKVAPELADVVIPLLVLAETLGIDLEQEIRTKALGDVDRGVRGEKPEMQEPEWWCSQCGGAMSATEAQQQLASEGAVYCAKCKQWWIDNPPVQEPEWVPLSELRVGAIFETQAGARAVKSQYSHHHWTDTSSYQTQCTCVLLDSGEYAHFKDGNTTLVREIVI